MRHYLTIIKQVSKCEREMHGVWEAMLVYSIRKTIIESKSAVLMPLMYVNFYKELRSLYSQLGKRFKDATIECYRLIVSRTHIHRATCQPKQCQYYDFGLMYYKMGQYQEACDFFEEELNESNDVMHQVRTLVWLIYLYSYMEEYDKRNPTIARLQGLYYDVAAIPPDKLILDSDAALMFIQFYRAGEFFDEAQWLENQLVSGLQNLKNKVGTAFRIKQTTKDQKSLLDTAYKVLNNFFEAGNYSKTAEVGSILIKLIEKSDSFNDTKIELHLLVGKAKFHMGQYSNGMDHIERALLSIPNTDGSYEKEKSIACWYLIPRIMYIDTCYWLKWNLMIVVITPVVAIVGTGLYFVLSPFPFYSFEESLPNNKLGEKPILTLHQLSPSTALATKTTDLDIVDKCSKWFVIIQLQATEALSRVKILFELIKNLLKFPFIKSARDLLCFTVCVLFVWIKLMYVYIRIQEFRQPAKSRITDYYIISHYTFYGYAVVQVLLALMCSMSFHHAKTTVRTIRDPRFRYGQDGTPHSNFLDSSCIDHIEEN